YTFIGITGDAKCPAALAGEVTLDEGDDITCTITNDDVAPKLTLIKKVVNDNGGTRTASEWTLTAAGPTGISGVGPQVASDATFKAGTYALSESGPTDYTAGAWSCVGGSQDGANITLGLGESATCTIVNNDTPPTLKLVKVVDTKGVGTAVPSDWTLTATGPTSLSGAGMVESAVNAGTYDLSETGPSGYEASGWVCTGGTQVDGDTVSLALAQNVTCTITNALRTGSLLPTQTTCEQYAAGPSAWPAMYPNFSYQAKANKITAVSPGVIFYYNTITAPSPTFTTTVTQTNTLNWKPMLIQDLGQAILYTSNCTKAAGVTVTATGTNPYNVTFNVTGATPGAVYYIGIKYSPQNLVGQAVKKGDISYYTWDTLGQLASDYTIGVKPKK
nr:hypothetical protein [Propionibacterium sp.]